MGILFLCGNRRNLKDAKEQHLIHDLKEACEEVKILGAYQNDERKQG